MPRHKKKRVSSPAHKRRHQEHGQLSAGTIANADSTVAQPHDGHGQHAQSREDNSNREAPSIGAGPSGKRRKRNRRRHRKPSKSQETPNQPPQQTDLPPAESNETPIQIIGGAGTLQTIVEATSSGELPHFSEQVIPQSESKLLQQLEPSLEQPPPSSVATSSSSSSPSSSSSSVELVHSSEQVVPKELSESSPLPPPTESPLPSDSIRPPVISVPLRNAEQTAEQMTNTIADLTESSPPTPPPVPRQASTTTTTTSQASATSTLRWPPQPPPNSSSQLLKHRSIQPVRPLVQYEFVVSNHPLVVSVLLRAGYSQQELEENKDGVLDKAMSFLSQSKLKEHRRTFTISAPSSLNWSSVSSKDEQRTHSHEAPAKFLLRKRRNALVPMSSSKTAELLSSLDDSATHQLQGSKDVAETNSKALSDVIIEQPVGHQHMVVVDELIRTERAYMDSLQLFIREIVEPLRHVFFQTKIRRGTSFTSTGSSSSASNATDSQAASSISILHRKMLFNRFSESLCSIVNASTVFLDHLERKLNADELRASNETPLVSVVCHAFFSQLERFQNVYEEYIVLYLDIQEMVAAARQENEEIDELIRLHERYLREMVEWRQFKMESFLILPVQRLPRYHALLEDLRKGILEDRMSEEHVEQVDKLIKQFTEISMHCNSRAREVELAKLRGWQLQEELEVKFPVPTRQLLRETPTTEPLHKLRRNGKGTKECWLYLFDDMLICAKKEPSLIEQLFKAFSIRADRTSTEQHQQQQQQQQSNQSESGSRKKTEIPFFTTAHDVPAMASILVQPQDDLGFILYAGRNSLKFTCRDTQQRDAWTLAIQKALEKCRARC